MGDRYSRANVHNLYRNERLLKGTPITELEKYMDLLLRNIKRLGDSRILLCSLSPLHKNSVRQYNSELSKLAEKYGEHDHSYSVFNKGSMNYCLQTGCTLTVKAWECCWKQHDMLPCVEKYYKHLIC